MSVYVKRNSLSDPGRGDDDESVGRREGDGDEGRVMEQDLVEGSVTTAAAAALASAATKAKVKPAPSLQNGPIAGTESQDMVVI